ncbi:uncharacterized protein LOC118450902 [Vespa mandarinia]|uniref:uncharacterized protein LOC118450902 n=1 Tax=Vespa mandarinia TaxID=7446 RepID=UPI001608DC13|nr:uncharacterized protein LOC118450902 [Vespa mandarinia]
MNEGKANIGLAQRGGLLGGRRSDLGSILRRAEYDTPLSIARRGLITVNISDETRKGSTSSFRRPGYREAILEVSLASEHIAARSAAWWVIDYIGSVHQYILLDVHDRRPAVTSGAPSPRWNIAKMDGEGLSSVIDVGCRLHQIVSASTSPTAQARMIIAATMQLIQKSCAIAVPEKSTKRHSRPILVDARDHRSLQEVLKDLPSTMWPKNTEVDLQGQPETVQEGAVPGCRPDAVGTRVPDCHSQASDAHSRIPAGREDFGKHSPEPMSRPEGPQFTEEKLFRAAPTMQDTKNPGPDGLPVEDGNLPALWKKVRLVLISKGNCPADAASSYRPICIINTAVKLLEKLLRQPLHAAVGAAGDLSARQYGFRSGLSIIQAVQEVFAAAKMTERGNHLTRPLCLLATVNVRNAVNSDRWDLAMEALEHNFSVPEYLLRILGDYLNERFLDHNTGDSPRSLELISGIALGTIMGSDMDLEYFLRWHPGSP